MIFLWYADLKFTPAKEEISAQGSAFGGRGVTGALAAVTFRGHIDTATLPDPGTS